LGSFVVISFVVKGSLTGEICDETRERAAIKVAVSSVAADKDRDEENEQDRE